MDLDVGVKAEVQWAIVVVLSLVAGAVLGRMSRLGAEAAARKRRILTPSQVEQTRVRDMLADRCGVKAPAVVVDPVSGHAIPCRFDSYDDETLRLVVPVENKMESGLVVHAMAAVQFNLEGRARMFIAPVMTTESDKAGLCLLGIATPAFVADGETRGAFRVAISDRFEVSAIVLHGMKDYAARVVDLSTTGAGIVFEPGAMPRLAVGEEVELRLSFDGQEAQRTAIVRRISGEECGLSLNASSGDTAAADEVVFGEFVRGMIDKEACADG